ncbi:Copper homeostasis protein CutC [Rubripirellula lacrimiformis]|uniref:PF03932 family protein CutC n=1 Tax=Rubripirellula lacrimiformis TaxID=1930273 RepID=A0A517NGN8_9BACT|nr:copper homeostasis protein CutC [Rubripirellula lacrimiformis]QDT06299.1 Copper homeostasis protein CutC [Rubripirellula lacrimiformis]
MAFERQKSWPHLGEAGNSHHSICLGRPSFESVDTDWIAAAAVMDLVLEFAFKPQHAGIALSPQRLIEVCVDSVQSAIDAVAGGADRLELCQAIQTGGLTPSVGLMVQARQAVDVPIIALIRPRGAGFGYSGTERRVMMRDVESLLSLGADGVAVGCLTAAGTLDLDWLGQVCRTADQQQVVCHRAFDVVPDQGDALQQLIDIGVHRVLTSGRQATAWHGRTAIQQIQIASAGKIEVLPGAGITPDNVVPLIRVTGCDQVHGTFRDSRHDQAGPVDASDYPVTNRTLVAAVRAALDGLPSGGWL